MNWWSLMLLATHICEQHSSVKVRLPLLCFFLSSSPILSTSLVYFFAGSSCSSRVLCVFWRQLLTFTLSQCFTGSLFFTSSLQHNFSGPKFFISLSLWWLTCSIGFFFKWVIMTRGGTGRSALPSQVVLACLLSGRRVMHRAWDTLSLCLYADSREGIDFAEFAPESPSCHLLRPQLLSKLSRLY